MSDILTPEQISNMRESAEFHGYDYVLDSHEALRQQIAVAHEKAATCKWTGDDDGLWTTDCGNAYSFVWDGPEDNGQQFCGYCGKRLIQVAYVEPVEPNDATGATP